jgi:hypothetical protein
MAIYILRAGLGAIAVSFLVVLLLAVGAADIVDARLRRQRRALSSAS